MRLKEVSRQQKAYKIWAPIYDRLYGGFLERAQRELAQRAGTSGRDILEIGVGTGLVLPLYPSTSIVTGIDISQEMLNKAQAKKDAGHLPHVRQLQVMDAGHLNFEDNSFDVVTLPFVITLIPDTDQLLSECSRVLRPDGEIIIASKISKGGGVSGLLEDAVSPIAKRMGLSTAYRVAHVEESARRNGLMMVENEAIPPFGFFRLLRLKRSLS
ncbi:class I SAM-dependent methyltransferase [Agrobacterium larrymoorei]|uniref:class I SAM-dependent methyltransferase n=1 Tax=Agrobacterium larrymoorei TaxID=160699 RepID=UPI001572A5CD|nr:class I SAM-dependent methyltransferase [Agrobacterium larrymoorei]NTJ44874.1 class I SAM-dependent methyltransferase [Agrobacterium larrymoorei]